ncbi:GMC oxidoreductase, partial [Chloroflexota bacterium]
NMKGGKEIPMAAGMRFENDGYLMTDMTMPKPLYQIFSAQVGRIDKLFAHSETLSIMVKAKDNLGGKITNWGCVNKTLSPDDLAKLAKGYSRARDILVNAGARNIYRSWYLASHPGGTAKIGEIVDSNLETELKGLYVCDCSVIPEAWGLPPILTIIGLGKRLANHINTRTEGR